MMPRSQHEVVYLVKVVQILARDWLRNRHIISISLVLVDAKNRRDIPRSTEAPNAAVPIRRRSRRSPGAEPAHETRPHVPEVHAHIEQTRPRGDPPRPSPVPR